MERLTAEDQLMLWPDEIWPQEIGAVAVLDGRAVLDGSAVLDAGGRPDPAGAVRRVVEARLHRVPRLRQRLYVPGRGLGAPLWVDDPAFELRDHIRVAAVPPPGDEAALLSTVERLRRRRLSRSRPLWEMWLLTGLPDNRIGLFIRMHHAIADGIAGVATVGTFLDPVPDAPAGSARPWTPGPWTPGRLPAVPQLLGDNARRHAAGLGRALSALARPVTAARHLRATWPAVRGLLTMGSAPGTSLDRIVGADRTLALVRTELAAVKAIAHAHGATVNDVLLAVTAGGLRALLRSRGEPVDGVFRVYVPVTLRPARLRGAARGNLVGQMVVPLPLGVTDPGDRLRRIATETLRCKAQSHPSLGGLFHSRLARLALLKLLRRQPVSVTTADVPGPPHPMYLAGMPLLDVYPVLPLIGNVSLGVGALSYADRFAIMVVADRDACPDLDVFAAGLRDELAALRKEMSAAAPQPQRRGASGAVLPRRG